MAKRKNPIDTIKYDQRSRAWRGWYYRPGQKSATWVVVPDNNPDSLDVNCGRFKCIELLRDEILKHSPEQLKDIPPTLADAARRWLKRYSKPSTHSSYTSLVNKILAHKISTMKMSEITYDHLDRLLDDIEDLHGANQRNRVLSPVLRGIYKISFGLGEVQRDPTLLLTNKEWDEKHHLAIDEYQLAFLLKYREAEDPWWNTALNVMAKLLLRRGELLALKWRHIDFGLGVVVIKDNVIEIRGKVYDQPHPKTKSSEDYVALPHDLRALLLNYRKWAQAQGFSVSPDAYVFPNSKGKAKIPTNFWMGFKRLIAGTDLPQDLTLHGLRRTMASLLLRSREVSLDTAQRLLRHSSPDTTLRFYREFRDPELVDAAARIDSLVRKAAKLRVVGQEEWGGLGS